MLKVSLVSLDGWECHCRIKGEGSISTRRTRFSEEEIYSVFDLVGSQAGYSGFQVMGMNFSIPGFFGGGLI